jgi:hypothetical protein
LTGMGFEIGVLMLFWCFGVGFDVLVIWCEWGSVEVSGDAWCAETLSSKLRKLSENHELQNFRYSEYN